MNNHLLPYPYNLSHPPTWLEHLLQPLINLLLSTWPKQSKLQTPPNSPISLQNTGYDTALPPIRIICISDTHNTTPPLPPGDILIHSGDLTAHGTLDEIQAQLHWLSSQPHLHKIIIAGNHDILLDETCDTKFLTRTENSAEARKNLDWGGIKYLQDESITLSIPTPNPETETTNPEHPPQQPRTLKIYGSPQTPECGTFAFQYPAIRDIWTKKVPANIHGPPALYGDCDGEIEGQSGRVKVKGDGYLLREIRRMKPRMVVCGHVHGAFGVSVIRHDGVQDWLDGLKMGWDGYGVGVGFGGLA